MGLLSRFTYFANLKGGETVFSGACRTSFVTGAAQNVLLTGLGAKGILSLLAPFPGFLGVMAPRMPEGHVLSDPEYTIDHNMTFGYYTYFDSRQQQEKLREVYRSSNYCKVMAIPLGLANFRCRPATVHPRFCVACLQADRSEVGFAYYHREHQLPGAVFCWRHERMLSIGCARCGALPLLRGALAMPGSCRCKNLKPLPEFQNLPRLTKALVWIAKQSARLVSSPGRELSAQMARALAVREGFCWRNKVDYAKAASAIEERYGRETLDWLGYPVETNGRPSSWFRTFLYDSTEQLKFTSITAILYLGVFFKSIEEFETAEIQPIRESSSSEPLKAEEPDEQAEPETKPSWTIRISVLLRTHSLARTAERCKVPLHVLAGEAAKQGIVVPLNARYAKKLGARRLGKLIDSIRSGEPFEILMRRYHVSYPGIYEIALSQPGLLAARDEKGVLGKALHLKQHQEAILKYKLRHPNASRADIFRDLSASYTYVRNHSLAWFEAEFPEKAPVRPAKSAGRHPDWPRCDAALAKRIESVADDLKSKKERPERASKERLLMLSGGRKQYYGSPNRNRFPKTEAMLDANTESVPEFRVRLIRWAVRELVAAGEIVTITKLILKTGMHSSDLRRYVGVILQVVKERGGKANITATWSIAA